MRFVYLFLIVTLGSNVFAQRGETSKDFPVYDNGGLPDLTIDVKRMTSQMEIVDRYFDPVADACAFEEFAIGGEGYRRLLRFDTVLVNGGDGDLVVGDRSDPDNDYARWFYFAECHGHYHLRDFSIYELVQNNRTVVAGTKQGFCMEDSLKYGDTPSNGYDCEFQGITSGWGDWYYKQLDGQWIDITGIDEGWYTLRVGINKRRIFDEGEDLYPNVVEVPVYVPSPRKKVAVVSE